MNSQQVWQQLNKASFAVLGYETPGGEPRSSGVVFKTLNKRLYVAVGPDSWKVRHIARNPHVSVTVTARRGGILALIFPIPPATISFHARAIVHPAGSVDLRTLSRDLESIVPEERRSDAVIVELIPEGRFLTYGLGVSLSDMRKPKVAEAVVPIAA